MRSVPMASRRSGLAGTASVGITLALTCSVVSAAQPAPARASAGPQSEARTWSTPWENTRPRDPFVDKQGRVWFVGQVGNYVANLNPRNGEFKRYAIDPGTNPHNLVVDAKGMVWFTGNANGRIVRMDPVTGKLTTFPMPDATVRDPHTMTFDRNGDAWFTAQGAGVVGKLTPSDGKIRLWRMARGSRPYGILVDSHDRPWFDLFGTNQIGTIDPRSGEFNAYTLPNDRSRPRRIAITPDDAVWYGDYTRGYLGHLDPRTGAVQEYALPSGLGSLPYAMTVDDRGRIWLAETGVQPNRLVAFDPAKKAFTESVPIAATGGAPNTIRHMVFDKATRQIWFGGDANMIGRVQVTPEPVVP
jgi:virginiamycin B lyase